MFSREKSVTEEGCSRSLKFSLGDATTITSSMSITREVSAGTASGKFVLAVANRATMFAAAKNNMFLFIIQYVFIYYRMRRL